MKRSYTSLLLAVLCCAGSLLTPPLHAQGPPWECINSPEMTGHAQVATNSAGEVLYTCGNWGSIVVPGITLGRLSMAVPLPEFPSLRVALDDSARPWMISERYVYRAVRPIGVWLVDPHPREIQAPPRFLTLSASGALFISDPAGGALRSTDDGRNWSHVGPSGASPALGMQRFASSSLLMWTTTQLYLSTDDGEAWSEITLPAGSEAVHGVHADADGVDVVILRDAAYFLARTDQPGNSWELLSMPVNTNERIACMSGHADEMLVLVETGDRPYAVHLPAGSSSWWHLDKLPYCTRNVSFFGDGGNVLVARPNALDFANAPDQDIRPWIGAGNVTDSSPMLCVDDETFVIYKHEDGFYRSTDKGTSWLRTQEFAASSAHDLRYTAANGTMSCGTFGDLFLSNDNGASWQRSAPPHDFYSPRMAELPSGELFMIGRADDGIIRSSDFGASWTEVRAPTGRYTLPPLHAIGDELFVLLHDSLFSSTDRGMNWTYDAGFHPPGEPTKLFMLDHDLIFAIYYTERRMYRSTDRGRSWTPVPTPDKVNFYDMQNLPHSATIFAYASSGGSNLHVSHDYGASWNSVPGDVAASVFNIRLSPQGHLVVSTAGSYHGHFLWRNAAALTSAGELPAAEQPHLTVWPQPAALGTPLQVEITLDAPGSVQLELFDLLGRQLAVQRRELAAAGTRQFSIPTYGLRPGMYLLRLIRSDEASMATTTLVIQ